MKIEISFDNVDEMLKFARELTSGSMIRWDVRSEPRVVPLGKIEVPVDASPIMRSGPSTVETLSTPAWVGLNPEPEPGAYPGPGPRIWGQPASRRPRDPRLVAQTPVTQPSGITAPSGEEVPMTTWLATSSQDDNQIQSQTEEGA